MARMIRDLAAMVAAGARRWRGGCGADPGLTTEAIERIEQEMARHAGRGR
jgi:hypothetical protein